MSQIRTHYDNLKVARNAPPEVIKAAYKILAQKLHPDRNPENPNAAKIMAIINASYEVLSDVKKRQTHDEWIARQEKLERNAILRKQAQIAPKIKLKPEDGVLAQAYRAFCEILAYSLGYVITIILIVVVFLAIQYWRENISNHQEYQANPIPAQSIKPNPVPMQSIKSNPVPTQQQYTRPKTAPNGKAWPLSAGYVEDYPIFHNDGLSTVSVDNRQNDSDVFVKLVSLDGIQAYPVRQFYIPAFSFFTLNSVTAGNYDIRYRDISNGGLSRSEAFNLQEIVTYDGTQFSNITMTLYKVENGNMQTYGLSEKEF